MSGVSVNVSVRNNARQQGYIDYGSSSSSSSSSKYSRPVLTNKAVLVGLLSQIEIPLRQSDSCEIPGKIPSTQVLLPAHRVFCKDFYYSFRLLYLKQTPSAPRGLSFHREFNMAAPATVVLTLTLIGTNSLFSLFTHFNDPFYECFY